MENLNAEQIKKALECCKTPLASDCENCSYTGKRLEDGVYEGCVNCLVGDALALINSQEQRIKELEQCLEHEHASFMEIFGQYGEKCDRLAEENANLHASCTEFERKCASLNDEVERLKDSTVDYRNIPYIVADARADTVRKMQERLKAESITIQDHTGKLGSVVLVGTIDQIVKEMLKEE